MTVIQIRGTSGSGKTYVMKKILGRLGKDFGRYREVFVDGRKKPLYYFYQGVKKRIYVLGHYESACGGCDNIGSAAAVYELIRKIEADNIGTGVIVCEGLLLSEDVKWSSQLTDLRVMFLTTTLEACLKQIENRRKEAGNTKPLNPANTSNRVSVIERARLRLIEAGIYCRRASANQAVSIILNWIKSNV